MSLAAYTPWSVETSLEVPTPWAKADVGINVDFVIVTWAAAGSAEALVDVCQIVAAMAVRDLGILAQEDGLDVDVKYMPGLNRLECPDCGETWDAWADDDGHLLDERDAECGENHPPRRGLPAA